MKENENGQKNFLQMRKDLADHPIEKVGEKLRGMMPWISDNKIIDKDKN
jgi:ketol-acid reductoisomerase